MKTINVIQWDNDRLYQNDVPITKGIITLLQIRLTLFFIEARYVPVGGRPGNRSNF